MFILPGMIIQMQASKTNCQMVLMELWCPQLLFPPSIQWCFMPERSCFDGYGYGLQAQELIQQCCAIYWAVYQAVLFATLPCFAGWYAKHESSSSRRVNGNSQSAMGPCLTHHREDKSWFWLLQKTAFSLVKSRLALESPGCSFVYLVFTMLKMAQYTGKCLLTAP